MIPRPDLLDNGSPKGLKVYQLTSETDTPACHVYMEAQVFHPDGKQLVLHRDALPHGGTQMRPGHRFLRCDLDDNGKLTPITVETGAQAPSIDPTGQWMYYFVTAESRINAGRIQLMRVSLDTTRRETICVIDKPLSGIKAIPSLLYPLSTISSDGLRLATSAFVGDGNKETPDYALLVFDLQRGTAEVILIDPALCNAHAQYCRSKDPSAKHDLLIQMNHGHLASPTGETIRGLESRGVGLFVIRDDGTNQRDVPVGRDRIEYCQGHQCWRGESEWIIVGNGIEDPNHKHGWGQQLIECLPANQSGQIGRKTPGAIRHHLSGNFSIPDFRHFQTDRSGQRLITDCGPFDEGGQLFLATLGKPGDPARWSRLLNLRCTNHSNAHAHPFLSPDGTRAFFNSDESGTLQAYMVEGLEHAAT